MSAHAGRRHLRDLRFHRVEDLLSRRAHLLARSAAGLAHAPVHEFLRYQITEHATGDPLTVAK